MDFRQTFVGEYHHSLDAKNRLFIPAKYRELLGDSFMIAHMLDDCLLLFSMEGWSEYTAQLLNGVPRDVKMLKRMIFSRCAEVTPDAQGRVVIPAHLCESANLKKNVVVAGAGTYAEIWDADGWNAQSEAFENEDTKEALRALGY